MIKRIRKIVVGLIATVLFIVIATDVVYYSFKLFINIFK